MIFDNFLNHKIIIQSPVIDRLSRDTFMAA